MARTALAAVAIPATGYNETDSAAYATLATGAGNGKEIVYDAETRIKLKNGTGGPAAFTIKIPTPPEHTAVGSTVSDVTITVADGKEWVLKPAAIFVQPDRKIYIDCDVAASLLVLK